MATDIKKLSALEMKERKVNAFHFIPVSELGFYGFTNKIIGLMQEFEIFPQLYLVNGKLCVLKVEVFTVVERILLSTMSLYRERELQEKAQAELAEMLERDGVKLDPQTLQPVETAEGVITPEVSNG
jgi:hypothetical protein